MRATRFRYEEFIEPYKSKFGGDLIWFQTVTHGAARESRLTVAKLYIYIESLAVVSRGPKTH